MLKTKRTYLIPIIGFALIILIGSFLLNLPVCNRVDMSFRDCLFVATSGITTTGITKGILVEQFTFLGQVVLAILMEIGAMGFIIFVSYFWTIKHKKMRMSDIMIINDNINGDDYSNIKKHSIFICKYMFRVQAIGILLLLIRFWPLFGFFKGTWYSIFHVIAAFSNTGFDLFGVDSITMFAEDWYVQLVTILVMVLGSLGILVIEDLKDKKLKFDKLKVQTKIVLIYSIVLLIVPTFIMKFYEEDLTLLNSLFMVSSSRSTAFSITNLEVLTFQSKLLLAILMVIGGGPTSTAGGIRIIPIAILLATVISTLKGKTETIIFWKKIPDVTIRRAMTIVIVFIISLTFASLIFYEFNDVGIGRIVFDCISALSNTGFSIIPKSALNVVGDTILMVLMFIGRVGPLSMLMAFVNDDSRTKYIVYPSENIVL